MKKVVVSFLVVILMGLIFRGTVLYGEETDDVEDLPQVEVQIEVDRKNGVGSTFEIVVPRFKE